MRSAAIEMQTIGRLGKAGVQDRPATGTDLMLMGPLFEKLLQQLGETTQGPALETWADQVVLGPAFETVRAAGLVLEDDDFRVMRMSVDLSVAERVGEIVMALPNHKEPVKVAVSNPADLSWEKKMRAAVYGAPAVLVAVLHKMTLPLGEVNALKEGIFYHFMVQRWDQCGFMRLMM